MCRTFVVLILVLLTQLSCVHTAADEFVESDSSQKLDTDKLDSVIFEVQTVLISNLSNLIETKGIEEAAFFCANKAQFLTDSMSRQLGVAVKRISDRHRNPLNATGVYELEVMEEFKQSKASGSMSLYQVDYTNKNYYKPIVLGMPLCLKCHGNSTDRDESAYEVIRSKYPEDLAIDYSLGDLRGMWVVNFESEQFSNGR